MTDLEVDQVAVKAAMQSRFADRLSTLFAASLGRFPLLASESQNKQHFDLVVQYASKAGFGKRNLCVKYCFVASHLGLFFDHDPLLQDLRKSALWMDKSVHGIVGLNRMFDHADLMISEGLINRDTGFAPGLIEACEMPAMAAPAYIIADTAPKRARAFGSEAIDRACAAAAAQCAADMPLSGCTPRDAAIACHFIGFGFWLDPLYRWVPDVLSKEGLVGLGERLNA